MSLKSRLLERANLSYLLLNTNNYFCSEFYYTKDTNLQNPVSLLTNFTGSVAQLLMSQSSIELFVDGRYTLQAKQECNDNTIINECNQSFIDEVCCKISQKFSESQQIVRIGYIEELTDSKTISKLAQILLTKKIKFELLDLSIHYIKQIYNETNTNQQISLTNYGYLQIGSYFEQKSNIIKIQDNLNNISVIKNKVQDKQNFGLANSVILIDNAQYSWLSGERDLNNPFSLNVNTFAIIDCDNDRVIKFDNIYQQDELFHNTIHNKTIYLDQESCTIGILKLLSSNQQKDIGKIVAEEKAIKSETQIDKIQQAHIYDGVVWCKLLYWIENHIKKNITESDISNKLLEIRKTIAQFITPSFPDIIANNQNAGIVHYRHSLNNSKIATGLLLIDIGSQYYYGTTDCTRTILVENLDNLNHNEVKRNFTLVLKGHLSIATERFTFDTHWRELDSLARKFLSDYGLEFGHSVGHGVSFVGDVHEGPFYISKKCNYKIRSNVVMSNEPGYYCQDYGMRIESLFYLDKELNYHTLTLVPIDHRLIDFKLLNNQELNYLKNYHQRIFNTIAPLVTQEERLFLEEKTLYYTNL